ncbi:MAG: MerR family transcriptional regulator [Micromonosporaceae bacterium]|nr:MerR family transcriptional regulator [Micromonosporaceae bacterium]
MSYPVGEVARMTGVTVRTLHHYDEIGLLSPSGRTAAGYRRYAEADLERLQQILTYRELGFRLEEIASILADPDADALGHLRRQHALLTERMERLHKMIEAIEFMMEAEQMGVQLSPEERFEVFGDFDPDQHAAEAERRWGGTEAYRQSQRRTASYTKDDWLRIKEEGEQLSRRFAAALAAGEPATSPAVMDLAEQHRAHIGRWFYDCSYEIHRGLGELYVSDQRFTDSIDQYAAGLAGYLRDAFVANADRAAG